MQKLLIKQAKIIDSRSKWNQKSVDLLIENGIIQKIETNLQPDSETKVVSLENIHVSPGFFDPTVHFCDPGEEHKEDIESGIQAAARGGYTAVGVLGITHPPVTEKTRVQYIKNKSHGTCVNLIPVGCVTQKNEGKELAELYDMYQAGSPYFFDGKKQLNTGILSRALAYSNNFNSTILSYPDDKDLSNGGLMHEGLVNIELGLKGIPALAEELGIVRDLSMAHYHQAHVHIANVSTKNGITHIAQAKENNIKVTAQCSIHHLFFLDDDLKGFDSNLKILPPLRSSTDRDALIQGLQNGTIDTITSDHTPEDIEAKKMEFDMAEYGAAGIETCFSALNTVAGKLLGLNTIVELLAIRSRAIFGISVPVIEEGATAELAVFDPTANYKLTAKEQASKAYNNPYLNKPLTGIVYGVVNGQHHNL